MVFNLPINILCLFSKFFTQKKITNNFTLLTFLRDAKISRLEKENANFDPAIK